MQRKALLALSLILYMGYPAHADQQGAFDVLTHHYDNERTGWNNNESLLTPDKLKQGEFGLLYKVQDFDEQIDAQPLIVNNLAVGAGRRDVAFIATENNTLYAIDAGSGNKIASRSFGAPVPSTNFCGNGSDHLGINSTPVINDARDTLYLIAPVWQGISFDYFLHAVDLSTIADPSNPLRDRVPPVKIAATGSLSDGSTYAFDPTLSRQRPGLLFSQGRVYAGFGTFCDSEHDLSRGWLLGWEAATLKPLNMELLDHRPVSQVGSGRLGAIWMSGYGPAADREGNIYVVTGNSTAPSPKETLPVFPVGPGTYLSDSVVKFDPSLHVLDWFTPSDKQFGQQEMDAHDTDFGSGGILLVPEGGAAASLHTKAALAAGKTGQLYLMDRDNLGTFDQSGINHVMDSHDIGNCYCGQSYFEGSDRQPRIASSGDSGLSVWTIKNNDKGIFLNQEYTSSEPMGTDYFQHGFLTSVSSNSHVVGTTVIWAIRRPQKSDDPQNLHLHAFDATQGMNLCSADAGPWPMNKANQAAPNVVPVVSNGRVFVGSYKELWVFGNNGTPACGVQIASKAEHHFAARVNISGVIPKVGQFGIIKGVIVDNDGLKLHLKSTEGVFDIDLSKVMRSGRHGNLEPGKPVTVKGTVLESGSILADSIHSGD